MPTERTPSSNVEATSDRDASGTDDPEKEGRQRQDAEQATKFCRSCGSKIRAAAELCPECGVRVSGSPTPRSQRGGPEPTSRMVATLVGGLVGFVVSLVLPIVGQFLGSGLAGYLRGDDTSEGAIVGALAALFATLPVAFLFVAFFGFISIPAMTEVGASALGFLGVPLVLLGIVLAFVAAVGAFGGFVGAALSDRQAPET